MNESNPMPRESQEEVTRLRREIESLRAQLAESQETLRAIREGEVDALVASTPEGERIFTLRGGEHPYRALIEQMREGALCVERCMLLAGEQAAAEQAVLALEQQCDLLKQTLSAHRSAASPVDRD